MILNKKNLKSLLLKMINNSEISRVTAEDIMDIFKIRYTVKKKIWVKSDENVK